MVLKILEGDESLNGPYHRAWFKVSAAAQGAALVTYSAKGSVRQALQKAGFEVERLEGALGKRHMVRGRK